MRRAIFAGWVLAVGCGREDVVLYESVDATDGATSDGTNDAAEVADSKPTCPPSVAGKRCQALGAACSAAVECCSGRCERSVCLEPGSCTGPGAPCASRATCCSGLCEPVAGSTERACLGYCRADGTACTRALDCCSMACRSGVCGGELCAREGQPCAANGDCCGGICAFKDLKCAADPVATCRATAEDCTSGGGTPCCGPCNPSSKRCDQGAGPCRPVGATCVSDGDCCRGTCAVSVGGVAVCTAPCLADGAGCRTGAECCAGSCNGWPGVCGPPPAACRLIGEACGVDTDCCSAQCLGGTCGNKCPAP